MEFSGYLQLAVTTVKQVASWKVPLDGWQTGLNPVVPERIGVRFLRLPPRRVAPRVAPEKDG